MKSRILTGIAAASLLLCACNTQDGAQSEAKITPNSTDDQKFAYMLGAQFALHNFRTVPIQMGEELDEDVVVQGLLDGVKSSKDTTFTNYIVVSAGPQISYTAAPDSVCPGEIVSFTESISDPSSPRKLCVQRYSFGKERPVSPSQ